MSPLLASQYHTLGSGVLILPPCPAASYIVTRANTKPAGVRQEARRRPQQQLRPGPAAAAHQGGGGGHSRPPEHLQQLGILAQQCPGMRPAASARLPHPVFKMLPGCRLGLALVEGEEGGQPEAASPPWAPGQLLPGGTGGSGGGDVLCFASDGAVMSVSVRDRTAPTSTSLLGLQSALQRLPAGDLALLTGVLQSQDTIRQQQESAADVTSLTGTGGSSSRHAMNWQLAMGAGGSGQIPDNAGISGGAAAAAGGPGVFPPHFAAASRPQLQGGAATLPGNSVDGALLRLLAGLPREVRQRLVDHLEP